MATAKFPTSVATDGDLLIQKNRAQTTLVGALNASDTSFTLASDAFAVNMAITIDAEIIVILAKTGATVTSCTRGYDGTSAASHTNGRLVSAYVDAIHHNQVSAEIQAIETALGAAMVNVPVVSYPIAINKGGTGAITQAAALAAIMGASSLPIANGGTAATTASGARASLSAAILGPNNDITSLSALSTPLSVPQGGSGAATLTGVVTGNSASAMTAVAASSELQYLRRKPNAGATPVYEFAGMPTLRPSDYAFTAQTPGGSLSIGSNTITLSPMPLGITADSVGISQLYISAGTGTAEAVPITGFTATTVTVTCANTHSSTWTIQSATAGIQEAIIATAGSGKVLIPAGASTLYGKITVPATYRTSLRGSGMYNTFLNTNGTTGDWLVFNTGSSAGIDLGDFCIQDLTATLHSSGSMVKILNRPYGSVTNLFVNHAYDALVVDTNANAFYSNIFIGCAHYGLWITSATQSTGSYANILVSTNGTFAVAYRIDGQCAGISFTACGCGAAVNTTTNYGVYINQTTGAPINELCFSNCIIDGHGTTVAIAGYGTYTNNGIIFTGCRLNAANYGIVASGSMVGIQLVGCTIYGSTAAILFTDVKNCVVNSCRINGDTAGINLSGGTITNSGFKNNIIGRDNVPGYGIALADTLVNVQISDNDVTGSVAPFLFTATSGFVLTNNLGIDNVIPAVASAATLVLPYNPNFTITGTTTITAITSYLPTGSRGTLVATSGILYFVASGSIGRTVGISPNVPYTWHFDGTKLWVGGQRSLVSTAAATNSTSSIGSTILLTAPTAGLYRVGWVLNTGSVSGGSGTSLVTFGWTDAVGAKTSAGGALTLAAAANQAGSILVNIASGNLTYTTTYVAGSGGNYNLQLTAELVQ